jgi:hypothetical protein
VIITTRGDAIKVGSSKRRADRFPKLDHRKRRRAPQPRQMPAELASTDGSRAR